MKYKVHMAYVSSNNGLITAGVYDENELDIAEARRRSVVTAHTEALEKEDTVLTTEKPLFNNKSDIITLEPEVVLTKLPVVDINKATMPELLELKYIGTKKADLIVKYRPFTAYEDLNNSVPLPNKKKWEDVFNVRFTVTEKVTNQSQGLLVTEL